MLGVKKIKKYILDLLFPINCLGCGREGFWLCNICQNKLRFNENFICPICRKNSAVGRVCSYCKNRTDLSGCLVVFSSKDYLINDLIKVFKYNGVLETGELIADKLDEFLEQKFFFKKEKNKQVPELFFDSAGTLVISVPLHKKRFCQRGFNQAEILAEKFCQKTGLRLENKALTRKRYTYAQAKLKKSERLMNLKDAFEVLNYDLKGKNVILIDDIYTTGSTLQECASILKKSGASEIWAVVLSRGA